MADYWADEEPPSANGPWEAGPVWGMTFGYPEKAVGLPSLLPTLYNLRLDPHYCSVSFPL